MTGNTSRAAQNVVREMDPDCSGQGGGAWARSGGGRLGYGASGCHILGSRPPQVFLFFLMIIIRTTMRQVVSLSLVTDTVRSRSHPGHRRCFVLGRTQTWMPRTRAHAPVLSGLVFLIVAVLLARTLETCVPLAHCAQRATRNLPWPGSLAES